MIDEREREREKKNKDFPRELEEGQRSVSVSVPRNMWTNSLSVIKNTYYTICIFVLAGYE